MDSKEIEIEVYLDKEIIYLSAILAHEKNITLNQFFVNTINEHLSSLKSQKEK